MVDINSATDARSENPTAHGKPAGNWTDDDGLAIDSYFLEGDHSPIEKDYTDPGVPELEKPTRVLSRMVDMGNYDEGQSVLLWPSDLNRLSLHIEATDGAGSVAPFAFSSEPITPLSAVPFRNPVDTEQPHTGPVYVAKPVGWEFNIIVTSYVVTC